MSGFFINIPANAGQNYKESVATLVNLPVSGNMDGDLRVVLDEHALYIWDESLLSWGILTGGGPGSGALVVDRFILSGGQIAAKAVTLSSPPVTPSNTILDPEGGPRQKYSVDFTVLGSTLSWNGLTLENILIAGEELIIIHD